MTIELLNREVTSPVKFNYEGFQGVNENVEKYPYKGIQKVHISTAAFLFNLKEGVDVVSEVNMALPPEFPQVHLEVYPMKDPFGRFTSILRKMGVNLPLPQGISESDICKQDNPFAMVSGVHAPFQYNGERFEALLNNTTINQVIWTIFFPSVIHNGNAGVNVNGLDLVRLNARLLVHPNVIFGLANDGLLDEIKKKVPIIVECIEPLKSHLTPNPSEFADPNRIAELVEFYELDGMAYAYDHLGPRNFIKQLTTKAVRDHLVEVHLAGRGHTPVDVEDEEFKESLDEVAITDFRHEVTGVLDYNPRIIYKLNFQEKVKLLVNNVMDIMQTQGNTRY